MTSESKTPVVIKASGVREISAQSKVLLALGEELMMQSLTKSQEFCKAMIGTSSAAVPIYIGLLTFVMPDREVFQPNIIWAIIPPLLFLMAMLIFIVGYLPVKGKFSLEIINEIEEFHEKTLKRRNTLIRVGVSLFSIGILWASVLVISVLYFQ
jgi:hypothetical protein